MKPEKTVGFSRDKRCFKSSKYLIPNIIPRLRDGIVKISPPPGRPGSPRDHSLG